MGYIGAPCVIEFSLGPPNGEPASNLIDTLAIGFLPANWIEGRPAGDRCPGTPLCLSASLVWPEPGRKVCKHSRG